MADLSHANKFLEMAITRYHNDKARREKEASEKARIEQIDEDRYAQSVISESLAHVFTGMVPGQFMSSLGNGRAQFGPVTFAPLENYKNISRDRARIGATFTCGSCGEEHIFPILEQFDLGEFLVREQGGTLPCLKRAKKETIEIRLLNVLREFMKQGG